MLQLRRLCLLLLVGTFALSAVAEGWAESHATTSRWVVEARYGESVRGTLDGAPMLVLRGTHHERGVAHGVLAAPEIIAVLDKGLLAAIEERQRGTWEQRFLPLSRQFHFEDRYEQELAGMLEGIRRALPSAEARTLSVLGREVTLDDLRAVQCLADVFGMGCSSFSGWGPLTADGQPVIGRTLDYQLFPPALFLLILAIEPAEEDLQPTIELSTAASIGASTAMNAEGVFVALHDSTWRSDGRGPFLPRMLALRNAVETARAASAVDDVTRALRAGRPAMGGNVDVSAAALDGAAPQVAVVEWDGRAEDEGATVRYPAADEPFLLCTNHYLVRPGHIGDNSQERYHRLAEAVDRHHRGVAVLGVDAASEMLDSVGRNGEVVTYIASIAWPAERRLAVAFTPSHGVSATRGRWIELLWDEAFAVR